MQAGSFEDTIAAISTARGEAAIGIVRLSGPDAIRIAQKVFTPSRGKDIDASKQRVLHGHIIEYAHADSPDCHAAEHDDDGAMHVDEVLLHVMRRPHSYTCEDVVEINCHGGPVPLQETLELVLRQGARLAEPGEFTRRAFLNGRIDLLQAEAVIDRIQARTRASLRAASAAGEGVLSQRIRNTRERLVWALSRIEASVDFVEQDLPELINEELRQALESCHVEVRNLLATADAGRMYREGASLAIAGRPNVGKSSLFNALLRETRAIVTAVPGTTRDSLEERISIQGIPVRIADTAGLHASEDEVERIGMDVARKALQQADLAMVVIDATEGAGPEDEAIARELGPLDIPMLLVVNKSDLAPNTIFPRWDIPFSTMLRVSATSGQGLEELEASIHEMLIGDAAISPEHGMITRVHQRDSLRRAQDALQRVLNTFELSPEFMAIEMREALHAIGELTGETTPDEVLDFIFSGFCIGK